ncbi:M14 family zinc carboxypeptidase [Paenibacillus sp. GCM10027626]|uniref:M14 family zinc carboxypeptidase n=1 Tax=Paenibacillus sp. GCM10027626 TaxID=3273411 RepID=UPI00362E8D18
MHFNRRSFVALVVLCSLFMGAFASSASANSQPQSSDPIVNPQQIYTYARMTSDLKALAKKYPELITLDTAGESEYGRELLTADIGRGPAVILLLGSHHAREWITTVNMMMMLEHMAIQYENNSSLSGGFKARELLDHVTFRLLPMVNPDGVTLQQLGLSAFPKADHAALIGMNGGSANFKRWKANGKGIDLNRQYPADWEHIHFPAAKPSYMNYKGNKPLQAKEVKAVYELTQRTNPEIAVAYHSSGEILYWNFHTKPANLARDYAFASAYARMTGYRMVTPSANPSGGGFTDWFIQDFGRPGLTPELGRSAGETNVPLTEWSRIWSQQKNTIWLMAQTAYDLWMKKQQAAPLHTDIRLTAAATAFLYPDLNAQKLGTLSPGRYKTLRKKGDWLEVQPITGANDDKTAAKPNKWISSRYVLSGPVDIPEQLLIELTPEIASYQSPHEKEPAPQLALQQASVREVWPDWLLVSTTEGLRWIERSDAKEILQQK